MHCPKSNSTKQLNLINTLLFVVLICCNLVETRVASISQYPDADDYFDRIYVINNDGRTQYLRLYCKERNMVSLSITWRLEFEEYPRFPVHSPHMETPRMQRKLYTFWQSCDVGIKINEPGSIIKLVRSGTQEIIFAINDYTWLQQGGDIQILTQDASTKWGMGQRFQNNFAITDGTWTIWNRDRPWEIDRGSSGKSAQTYGHQPLYLAHSYTSDNFHLVYFKNTYGFNLQSTEHSRKLKYDVVGGHIHFIIIVGNQPQELIKKYHHYIGPAMVPPFWSLGYHQSRWGYKNIQQFTKVINQFEKYQLPLDTMWSDLDYMDKKAIFTVDNRNYPAKKMKQLMQNKRVHYIPLIDVGVSLADRVAIDAGNKYKTFFKSMRNPKQNYIGAVWPGKVHFVDYLHPNASNYWQTQLDRLYEQIPVSGIWLDMNQPSNFQGNEGVAQNFRIQHAQSINMMTIDTGLQHYCKTCDNSLRHKEVHAYYGHLSTVPTYQFLKKKNGRPFIISRSNSVGTGVYAGHWTGDNVADWDFLRLSISGNFLFQIFGIQMVGADICGFHRNTNQQLCSRWMQVGSFYPFARNHNENESIPQQPYQFGNKLLETTKLSFYQRYSLLKQMYSTLVQLNGTGTFYRPLFFQFPKDSLCYSQKYVETQLLIGDYLLSAPIVVQGTDSRQIYFPKSNETEIWYVLELDRIKGMVFESKVKSYRSAASYVVKNQLPSPPPTFLRSGKLILVNRPTTRTADLSSTFSLLAALSPTNSRSSGNFLAIYDFTDNTQIDKCVQKGCSIKLTITKDVGNSFVLQWKYIGNAVIDINIVIDSIHIAEEGQLHEGINKINIQTKQGRQIINIR